MSIKSRLSAGSMVLFILFTLRGGLAAVQAEPAGITAADCSLSPAGAYDPTCVVIAARTGG